MTESLPPHPRLRGGADDELPDPMEPGASIAPAPRLPRGDMRWASWVALLSAIGVVMWYLSILVLGGVALGEFSTPAQLFIWGSAVVSFAAGLMCLNARRNREFAAAGFIAGVVSLLVSLTIGLPTGFQILL
ncbi:hypothetical protein ACIQLJ_02740 [Microbacterium sp. NPDC091313]